MYSKLQTHSHKAPVKGFAMQSSSSPFDQVVVHPLVLLSIVDHYNRVARDTRKRVVGVLLGEKSKGRLDVTNSFAVPFEEDERDTKIWFLDHSYLETMYGMFRKVNAREKIVGWYSTGPRLREADLDIQELFTGYCNMPVLVICEISPKDQGLPTTAYWAKEEIREDGTQKSQRVFVNLPTEVGATEAEEIGVEHLLRDVKDATVSTLATDVHQIVMGLRGLKSRLLEVQEYLEAVFTGKLPINQDIMFGLQEIFNLLPNLNVEELMSSFAVKSNDMMVVIYLASMIRSILALHNLIDNKEQRLGRKQLSFDGSTAALQNRKEDSGDAKAEKPSNGKTESKNGKTHNSKLKRCQDNSSLLLIERFGCNIESQQVMQMQALPVRRPDTIRHHPTAGPASPGRSGELQEIQNPPTPEQVHPIRPASAEGPRAQHANRHQESADINALPTSQHQPRTASLYQLEMEPEIPIRGGISLTMNCHSSGPASPVQLRLLREAELERVGGLHISSGPASPVCSGLLQEMQLPTPPEQVHPTRRASAEGLSAGLLNRDRISPDIQPAPLRSGLQPQSAMQEQVLHDGAEALNKKQIRGHNILPQNAAQAAHIEPALSHTREKALGAQASEPDTPAWMVLRNIRQESLDHLLHSSEEHAAITKYDGYGDTPLHLREARALLCEPDVDGNTPLHLAIYSRLPVHTDQGGARYSRNLARRSRGPVAATELARS
ncbi:hypothetical protein WJX84_000214 [Apatococcus fuscideae]|uniref:MPN domain-containing protein n=1 Tax=Apatococcus fuscideae TaxID=2026836 RepID=A0AAW1SMX2_9CHLO